MIKGDVEFGCPGCGVHIRCGAGATLRGRCPSCQQAIVLEMRVSLARPDTSSGKKTDVHRSFATGKRTIQYRSASKAG